MIATRPKLALEPCEGLLPAWAGAIAGIPHIEKLRRGDTNRDILRNWIFLKPGGPTVTDIQSLWGDTAGGSFPDVRNIAYCW